MTLMRPALAVPAAPWMDQVFSARAVAYGGVVRRSLRWIEREVGREAFVAEVHRRGWHLAECNGQFVVFCTPQPVKLHF
jgi:hypothetical protein